MAYIENCIPRVARKPHTCRGDGAAMAYRKYAHGHTLAIIPGMVYVEYVGETAAFHSGSAHCLDCAQEFFTVRQPA